MYFFSNPYYEGERDDEKNKLESTNNLFDMREIVDYLASGFSIHIERVPECQALPDRAAPRRETIDMSRIVLV